MAALTESTKLVRQAEAFGILIQALNENTTPLEICKQKGIDYRTYQNWISQDPSALDSLRQFIQVAQLRSLAEIEAVWPLLVNLILEDAVDPTLKTKERLAIAQWLLEYKEILEKQYHAEPGAEDEAHAFLKEGPALTKIRSRMASLEIEPSERGVTVHVTREDDVIDITP